MLRYELWSLLLLFLLGWGLRATQRQRPTPRRKPHETGAVAHLLMQGGFRFYTWLSSFAISFYVTVIIIQANDGRIPIWLWTVTGLLYLFLLLQTAGLYWRLGYGPVRLLIALCHLSPVLNILEWVGAMKPDMDAYMQRPFDHNEKAQRKGR